MSDALIHPHADLTTLTDGQLVGLWAAAQQRTAAAEVTLLERRDTEARLADE